MSELLDNFKVKRTKRPNQVVRVKSEYQRVELRIAKDGSERWIARMLNRNTRTFDTERAAAIAVDKDHILNGRSPVNILKRATAVSESSFWCMKHDIAVGQNVCTSQCEQCKSQ